jgi:hypothetical protein
LAAFVLLIVGGRVRSLTNRWYIGGITFGGQLTET